MTAPFDGQIENFTREETKPLTEPDVFSVEAVMQWAAQHPPETRYDWFDVCGCLLWQYAVAQGMPNLNSCGTGIAFNDGRRERIKGLRVEMLSAYPWTYGAFLSRARALRSAASGREGK